MHKTVKKVMHPLHKRGGWGHTFPPPTQGPPQGGNREGTGLQLLRKKVLTETKSLT